MPLANYCNRMGVSIGDRRSIMKFKRQDPSLKQLDELNESMCLTQARDMAQEALTNEASGSRSYNTRQSKRPRKKYDAEDEYEPLKSRKSCKSQNRKATPPDEDSDSTLEDTKERIALDQQSYTNRFTFPQDQLPQKEIVTNHLTSLSSAEADASVVSLDSFACWPVVKCMIDILNSEVPPLSVLEEAGVFQ